MKKLKDLSLRARLLLANVLMVAIPIMLLALLGAGALLALQLSGTQKQDLLAAFWPDQGASVTVQYAASSLRAKADRRENIPAEAFAEDFSLLESQGIACLLLENEQVRYVSPGAKPETILRQFSPYLPREPVLLWLGNRFLFRYVSPPQGRVIMAAGQVPFLAQNPPRPGKTPHVRWDLLWYGAVALGILLILALGLALSRLLSRQILRPLAALRHAAREIESGELRHPVAIPARDEIGAVCASFEAMRRSLLAARERQEADALSRKRLLAGISHDLSTPLTSIRGYADGLRDGIARTPEKRAHYLKEISEAAKLMARLVSDLFLLSKLDLGHVEFSLEEIALVPYFEEFAAEQREILREQGILFRFVSELPPEERGVARLDRQQFARILQNLFHNSRKYAGKSPVAVTVTLSRERKKLRVRVADDGRGVAREELPHLFEDFYRTDKARSHVESGSGLGLAIVRELALGMGGRVFAEETAGGGLTVVLEFPVCEAGKEQDA